MREGKAGTQHEEFHATYQGHRLAEALDDALGTVLLRDGFEKVGPGVYVKKLPEPSVGKYEELTRGHSTEDTFQAPSYIEELRRKSMAAKPQDVFAPRSEKSSASGRGYETIPLFRAHRQWLAQELGWSAHMAQVGAENFMDGWLSHTLDPAKIKS